MIIIRIWETGQTGSLIPCLIRRERQETFLQVCRVCFIFNLYSPGKLPGSRAGMMMPVCTFLFYYPEKLFFPEVGGKDNQQRE